MNEKYIEDLKYLFKKLNQLTQAYILILEKVNYNKQQVLEE